MNVPYVVYIVLRILCIAMNVAVVILKTREREERLQYVVLVLNVVEEIIEIIL